MIEFQHVSFAYETWRPVLQDVCFCVKQGETVGLIGANGAGKSTLMKALVGLLPTDGNILVKGVRLEKRTLPAIRRSVGFVLQSAEAQMFMPRVWDDMLFGPLNYGVPRSEAERRAEAVLSSLGLSDIKDRFNHRLSGGEKRMAAIATILCMEPEIIVMDEPTASLDPYNRRRVIETIRRLDRQTELIASHDLDLILDTCERVILLSNGQIVADGPARTILRDRALLERHRLELPLRFQGEKCD